MSGTATLTLCDREAIHIPGSIQPHGVMLVTDPVTLVVRHVAGPVEALLGHPGPGATLATLLGPTLADATTRLLGTRPGPFYIGRLTRPDGTTLDVGAFPAGNLLVIELEPAGDVLFASQVLDAVEEAATAFERAATIPKLCERAAQLIRRLTGYDRVMIYRFLGNESGEIVAESKDPALGSFLNHRFPASDIPRQARALYLRNLIRVIPTIDYQPQPLIPAWTQDVPLDMSDSSLRSVSPIHLDYLRNMGVTASASVSIVVDGELWALVACHNMSPRNISYDLRAACRTIAGAAARQIRAKQDAEILRQRLRLRSFEDEFAETLGSHGRADTPNGRRHVDDALAAALPALRRMLDADGIALVTPASLATDGVLPSRGEVRDLANWLGRPAFNGAVNSAFNSASNLAPGKPVLATSNLESIYPTATLFREHGSGVLALDLAADHAAEPEGRLLWFRAEQIEVLDWAGNPHKADNADPTTALTPRASFEAWQETVRGQARPWSVPEIESASRLSTILNEARQNRRLRDLNQTLSETLGHRDKLLEQTQFLMGEVNHRVQNSLQLVASFLTLQGRTSSNPELKAALDEARRRLNAVALVHRRLYTGDQVSQIDAARYVEELCAEALDSMGQEWRRHLSMDLSTVRLGTDQAVTIGLILTELLINVNKYAYGGGAGPIEVKLRGVAHTLVLTVSDSGVGKPATTATPRVGGGFGTRMMAGMVGHLRGILVYDDNDPGTRATLTVPLDSPA